MSRAAVLYAAAFGDDPGHWPLPAPTTSYEMWLRAVAAGGQGRYGAAAADLSALRRAERTGPLASLAHSTQGSFLRQLGGHAVARRWDGRAAMLAGHHAGARAQPDAALDALLGLAADALGLRRFAASAALLSRAQALLGADGVTDRQPLRWHWVAAELAMVRGSGAEAVTHAEIAVGLAASHPSARHRVKTAVVHAAALCSAGALDEARSVADCALSASARWGLTPLRWADACLLADIGSSNLDGPDVRAVRDACADAICRSGGQWLG